MLNVEISKASLHKSVPILADHRIIFINLCGVYNGIISRWPLKKVKFFLNYFLFAFAESHDTTKYEKQ